MRLFRRLPSLVLDALYLLLGTGGAIATNAYFGVYIFGDLHGNMAPRDFFNYYTTSRSESRTLLLFVLYLLAVGLRRLLQSGSSERTRRYRPRLWGVKIMMFAFVCTLGWLPIRVAQAAGWIYPRLQGCCNLDPPGQPAELVQTGLSLALTVLFPILVFSALRPPSRHRRRR